MTGIGASLSLVAIAFGVVLLILWVVLPFFLIKMNRRIYQQLDEQMQMNRHLGEIAGLLRANSSALRETGGRQT